MTDLIEQIKAYRAATGCGLEAAKKHVFGINAVRRNKELKQEIVDELELAENLTDVKRVIIKLVEELL